MPQRLINPVMHNMKHIMYYRYVLYYVLYIIYPDLGEYKIGIEQRSAKPEFSTLKSNYNPLKLAKPPFNLEHEWVTTCSIKLEGSRIQIIRLKFGKFRSTHSPMRVFLIWNKGSKNWPRFVLCAFMDAFFSMTYFYCGSFQYLRKTRHTPFSIIPLYANHDSTVCYRISVSRFLYFDWEIRVWKLENWRL